MSQHERFGAVIVAAGRSERMNGVDKLWAPLVAQGQSRPLLSFALSTFNSCPVIDRIALVVASAEIERASALVQSERLQKVRAVVPGGVRRQDSVRAGLEALEDIDFVAVHDGARPLVDHDLIARSLTEARETGASCCALPVPDTIKQQTSAGYIARTVDRSGLWLAQTPQTFRYDLLMKAHRQATADATDDASMLEALGVNVRLFIGSPRNLKVTTPEDIALAAALLAQPS